MHRLILVLLFLISLAPIARTANAPTTLEEPQNRYVLSLPSESYGKNLSFVSWLRDRGFDIAGLDWRRREIEVIVSDRGIEYLRENGIEGRVRARWTPGSTIMSPDQRFLNPEKVGAKLKALNAAYPKLTRLERIGQSLQGRPIWALLISTTPSAEDANGLAKPSIIFDGMHHAREIMTPEIVMDVAEQLLARADQGDAHARRIVGNWNTWVVPMLNVDGNNIVWTKNAWWRKNARETGGSIYGVDINRNYTYRWNGCGGSSGDRNNDAYRGASAGSEPETQALIGLANAVRPTASLSYHSYSELVLTPLGCRGELAADARFVASVAQELAKVLPRDDNRGNYTPGAPWQLLYAVDGDSMDYMYAAFGALAYTFEVNQDFIPSYDLREPTLRKHRVAWQYFFDRIDQNLLVIQAVDGKTGLPADAIVGINTIQPTKGELPFRTNAAGFFFKVLDKGAYIVTVKLGDGRSRELDIQMRGEPLKMQVVVP